jgi:hypothetical protein
MTGERMKTWEVYWSPEGRCIAVVQARTARSAIRKAYRKFLGELYAIEQKPMSEHLKRHFEEDR